MASSSDEGEIVEDEVQDLKASSLPYVERSGVDRQSRIPTRNSSPDDDSVSRHSSYPRRSRSPRGFKRHHERPESRERRRDYDARRNFRYDEDFTRGSSKRPRVSYEDLDRPSSSISSHSSRNRDHERDGASYTSYRHARRRSPSPRRSHRGEGENGNRHSGGSRYGSKGEDDREYSYDDRHDSYKTSHSSRQSNAGHARHRTQEPARTETDSVPNTARENTAAKEANIESDYVEPEEIDEEAEIERRRKRREELLAKSSSATPLLLHAIGAASDRGRAASPAFSTGPGTPQQLQSDAETPRTPRSSLASPQSPLSPKEVSLGKMNLADDRHIMNVHVKANIDDEDGPSAADYDPTIDKQEDERRDELRHGQVILHGESHSLEATGSLAASGIESNPSKENEDQDDNFDMFAEDFDEDKYTKPSTIEASLADNDEVNGDAPANGKGGILEGDDKDGYYKIRIGEVLNGRYQIQATLGRGMFSGVVRAIDITTKMPFAIKIMRNNDALRKGGYTEIAILQKLNDADPENRKHIVKFERSFDYRGHLCMAFENLSMNLREVLRKFGNNVGINLTATRTYAHQIFVALAHMRKCSIIHADLKPDNILVNETRNVLKICDLGTAIDRSDAATAHTEITPYLVSRFYRAPEIILGMPYDYGVDMWSIGCTLYEMYTGKILFTGDSNNQMLKAIMEIRGRFTPKLYKRGQLSINHFDELGQFVSVERDKVLGKTAVRTLPVVKPTRDLRTRMLTASSGLNDTEARDLNNFIDLLEHCLALNPDKRMRPADALKHPFFTAKGGVPRR